MSDKILNKVLSRFKHSVDSSQYNNWRTNAAEDQDFYDGDQLSDEDLKILNEAGQPDITINVISTKVDSIINQEIQNPTKTIYKPRTFDKKFEILAEGLTTLALNVQENADTSEEMHDVFDDQIQTGIGWMEIDVEEGFIITPRVDPFLMVWDINDTSKQLTNSSHVNRMKWYTKDEATMMFDKKAKEINELIGSEEPSTPFGLLGNTSTTSNSYAGSANERDPFSFVDKKLESILIVEQQYKKPKKKFRYLNVRGQQKETFDENMANRLSAPDSEVETINTFQVWRAYFTDGILFENVPHPVQIGEFTIIPTIHKRKKRTGEPYGIIRNSKDPQREVNKRRSKMMHQLNTRGVIMEEGAVDDVNALASEISRSDFIIQTKKGKELKIQDNLSLADSQARVMHEAKIDVSETMGVFNENVGAQTNATSGIGMQRRQAASVGTKGFAFSSFERFKKRFGRVLGVMMQTVFSDQHLLSLFGEDGSPIVLNKPYEYEGEEYFENDLSTLYFGVHVSQIPNFEADPEILAENLTNMAMNGQLQIVLQSPSLAKRMGLNDIEEIQEEMQAAGGLPSPEGTQGGSNQ